MNSDPYARMIRNLEYFVGGTIELDNPREDTPTHYTAWIKTVTVVDGMLEVYLGSPWETYAIDPVLKRALEEKQGHNVNLEEHDVSYEINGNVIVLTSKQTGERVKLTSKELSNRVHLAR